MVATRDFRTALPPEVVEAGNDLARQIDSGIPPGWGFTLLIWERDGRSVFYISNAEREGMVAALQEFLRGQAS